MWSYEITFKAYEKTLSFEVSSEDKSLIESFLFGFYELFGDLERQTIESLQKNDLSTQQKVQNFVQRFKSRFSPELNQVIAFFKNLENNEHFLFLPGIELSAENSYRFSNYLQSLKTGESLAALNENFEKVFGNVLENYHVEISGSRRKFVGRPLKRDRICRFCGKNAKETKFTQTAHAISEGLGNKKVFLYEECDVCNEKFSRKIEPDVIAYFSIFRTFFDIKGKGGSKELKGKDFLIKNKPGIEISFENDTGRPAVDSNKYDFRLTLSNKVNEQDIYRCLCKFVISTLPQCYFIELGRTVDWINKSVSFSKLPPIAELISYNHFTKEPLLFVYIRKNENFAFPYMVGEFHLACKIMTFIIPGAGGDKNDFSSEDSYEAFWNNFVHYHRKDSWVFNYFNSDKDREFIFNLKFSQEPSSSLSKINEPD